MSEEHTCEYCGDKDTSLVVYEFNKDIYKAYLCEECERNELEELEEFEHRVPYE